MKQHGREVITLGWRRRQSIAAEVVDDYVQVDEQHVEARAASTPTLPAVPVGGCAAQPALFASAGQAIHVAFLILAHDAQQDSTLRKTLVRILESVPMLSDAQLDWLGQLIGSPSETVRFEGLRANDVRAQCALIMSAVRTRLPAPEMWALQAKYGITEYEDSGHNDVNHRQLSAALVQAQAKVRALREKLKQTRAELDALRNSCTTEAKTQESVRRKYQAMRDVVRGIDAELTSAESAERAAQIEFERFSGGGLIDSGKSPGRLGKPRRRFAFSSERIAAIKGLAGWLQQSRRFDRYSSEAMLLMVARLYADHKETKISFRSIGEEMGVNRKTYALDYKQAQKILRPLVQMAVDRLTPYFREQGIIDA